MKKSIVERFRFFYRFFIISVPTLAVVIFSTVALKESGKIPSPLKTAFTTFNFTPVVNTPITGDVKEESSNSTSEKPSKEQSSEATEATKTQEKPTEEPAKSASQTEVTIPIEQIYYSTQSNNIVPAQKTSSKPSSQPTQTQKPTPIDYSIIHLDDQGHPINNQIITPTIDNDSFPEITDDICDCPVNTTNDSTDTAPDTPIAPDTPNTPSDPLGASN